MKLKSPARALRIMDKGLWIKDEGLRTKEGRRIPHLRGRVGAREERRLRDAVRAAIRATIYNHVFSYIKVHPL